MKRSLFPILVFGLILSRTNAQTPHSPVVDSLISEGMDQTFNCQFDAALSTFQKVIDLYPNNIIGYFYKAASLQSKLIDSETDIGEKEYNQLINKAIQLGKNQIKDGDNDPCIYYYIGASYGYKGLYQAKRGKYIAGFLSAKETLNFMKEALKRNSTIYDAYLIIGSYKYWHGRFNKYFNWLPIIQDEREEGIQLIKFSMDKGTYCYWVAVHHLAWIEYDQKNYELAKDLFLKGLVKYPKSRFFLWGLGDTYFRLKAYTQAAQIYEDILVSLQNVNWNNDYNEIVCRFKLIQTYLAQGNYEEALRHCNIILNKKVDDSIAKKIKSRREKTESYQRECIQHLHQQKTNRD